MRLTILAALIAAFSLCALAQEPKTDKKEAPAEVTIPAPEAQKLQIGALTAANALKDADLLEARIKEAMETLKKQREEAKKLQEDADAAFTRAAIKAGIPGDAVRDYSGVVQPDGSLKLTRRPPAAASAKP